MISEAGTSIARCTAYNMILTIPPRRQRTLVSKLKRQLPAPGTSKASAILKLGSDGRATVESGDDPVP